MVDDRKASGARPGVRSIAEATGLSVATVSRVLNGSAHVKAPTRDRVLAAVQRLGYAPNPAARALATKRTRTVGAIVPTLAHSIFARFLNAVELELADNGYALIMATSDGEPEKETTRARELLDLGAEALILSGLDHQQELLALIAARSIPTVCTSIYDQAAPLPTIGYDNEQLGRDAITYLQDLGHRRIAVIHGPLTNNDRTQLRRRGIETAHREGTVIDFHETNLDVAGGSRTAFDILGRTTKPTAILCASDVLALGVLFEAARQGIDVPDSLSVMGFDDLDWAEHSQPPLTTIRLPTIEMGKETARSIVSHLDQGSELAGRKLDAQMVTRRSTARTG